MGTESGPPSDDRSPESGPPSDDRSPAVGSAHDRSLTRRRFLSRTLMGAGLVAFGGVLAENLAGYPEQLAFGPLVALSAKEALILGAIARRMVAPDEQGAPSPDEIGVVRAADAYVAGLPDALAAELRALLHLVEHTPILFTLAPARFTRLSSAGQDALLADWESSRLAVRRQGFAGLKALVMFGYYGDPRAWAIAGWPGPMLPGAAR